MWVCVWGGGGGGGPVNSFKVNFNFPKFKGSNICYPGGGASNFFPKGVESTC